MCVSAHGQKGMSDPLELELKVLLRLLLKMLGNRLQSLKGQQTLSTNHWAISSAPRGQLSPHTCVYENCLRKRLQTQICIFFFLKKVLLVVPWAELRALHVLYTGLHPVSENTSS